jgi:hypothetical protein
MKRGINSHRTGNLLSQAGNLLRLAGNCPSGESQLSSSWMWTWLNLGARSARLFRPGNPDTDAIFAPLALDIESAQRRDDPTSYISVI